jgi:hypothetical protein
MPNQRAQGISRNLGSVLLAIDNYGRCVEVAGNAAVLEETPN